MSLFVVFYKKAARSTDPSPTLSSSPSSSARSNSVSGRSRTVSGETMHLRSEVGGREVGSVRIATRDKAMRAGGPAPSRRLRLDDTAPEWQLGQVHGNRILPGEIGASIGEEEPIPLGLEPPCDHGCRPPGQPDPDEGFGRPRAVRSHRAPRAGGRGRKPASGPIVHPCSGFRPPARSPRVRTGPRR